MSTDEEKLAARKGGITVTRVDREGAWGVLFNGLLMLSRWTYYISMVVIVLMLLILCVDVTLRLTVGASTDFGFEFTEYGLMWISILPGALYLYEEKHICVDFFYHNFKPAMKAFCDFLSLICTGFFSFVIMVYGIKMTAGSFETRELTNTPMSVPLAWVQIWVPIAFGVMGLMAVLIIVDKIAFSKTDKRHEKIANVGTTD